MIKQSKARRFKSGKQVKPQDLTKLDIVKRFASNLDHEIEEIARKLEHQENVLNQGLIKATVSLYSEIMEVTDLLRLSRGTLGQSAVAAVTKLEKRLGRFKNSPHYKNRQSDLTDPLSDLCEATTHFINQFNLTYGSILDIKKVPWRPTQYSTKALVFLELEKRQSTKPSEPLPSSRVIERLVMNRLMQDKSLEEQDAIRQSFKLSERTYRSYRKQYLEGKMGLLLQDNTKGGNK